MGLNYIYKVCSLQHLRLVFDHMSEDFSPAQLTLQKKKKISDQKA